MASNLGAAFTLIGALAGIMWANIIKRCAPRVHMNYMVFLQLVPRAGFACMVVASCLLWFEFAVFPS